MAAKIRLFIRVRVLVLTLVDGNKLIAQPRGVQQHQHPLVLSSLRGLTAASSPTVLVSRAKVEATGSQDQSGPLYFCEGCEAALLYLA